VLPNSFAMRVGNARGFLNVVEGKASTLQKKKICYYKIVLLYLFTV
jgi:hypothetical protein